jgi:hypothetical protein
MRKHFVQHRNDDRSAADTEQTGKKSRDHAAGDNGKSKPKQLV